MHGTVYQFPVRRHNVSASDKQMTESLHRLSVQTDAFVRQAQLFAEKVAAFNEAYKKARALLERL